MVMLDSGHNESAEVSGWNEVHHADAIEKVERALADIRKELRQWGWCSILRRRQKCVKPPLSMKIAAKGWERIPLLS
jgi:hypothetical protein